jgi:hypothetical protein
MQPSDPLTTLRALRGAPLSCLFALLLARQDVTARWLVTATGYGVNTVTVALAALEQFRFANCNSHRSAWRLAEDVQLMLPFGRDFVADPKNCDPDLLTTTTAIEKKNDLRCSSSNPNPKNCDPEFSKRIQALARYGISEPTASKLAALEWCHPDYVAAMAGQIKDRFSTSLLVFKIRQHDLASNFTYPEVNRRRYSSWEARSD